MRKGKGLMNYEVVSGIPGGILTCIINGNEVAIQKISPEYIEVLTAEEMSCEIEQMEFFYYDLSNATYREVGISNVKCIAVEKGEFSCRHSYAVENEQFKKMFDFVVRQYYRYIVLKSEAYDNEFSKVLVDYPSEKDNKFSVDYKKWNPVQSLVKKIESLGFVLAVSLENASCFQAYLKDSLRFSANIDRVYIGNAYCPHLFPDDEVLLNLLEKAKTNDHRITLVTSYLKETQKAKMQEKLQKIYLWCRGNRIKIEIEVNDWGILQVLCQKTEWFQLNFGRLLNKRRKDVRHVFKPGFEEKKGLLEENQLNQPLLTEFLREQQIFRFEYEVCGYKMKIADGSHSLHLPFYQSNTSQFCPLRALCEYGDRGMQEEAEKCPKYCETYACAYPEHLHMIGRYNSIFALDRTIFDDLSILENYKKQGIDRIVWNMI